MKCSCPKCAADIQIDLLHIPESGIAVSCPECKSRFWVSTESFACRALKKEGKIYCAKCSNELSHLIVCPECGLLYPDYCLVQVNKPVKKRAQATSSYEFNFSLKPRAKTHFTPSSQPSVTPLSRKSIQIIVGLLVLAAVVTLGANFYLQNKDEALFSKNYVLALYGIKIGEDLSLRQCAKISSDWKAKISTGQNMAPRPSSEDELAAGKVKGELDLVMKKLGKVPSKYTSANENLVRLYGIYARSYALAAAPPNSLPVFTDSAARLETEFKQCAQELKEKMPSKLSDEFTKGKLKYKNLQDL